MTVRPDSGEGGVRHCVHCGSVLAPGAAYCRACGARYEGPALAPVPPTSDGGEPPRRARTALWAGAAIVLVGIGVAAAILLAGGGDASRTTVLVDRAGRTTTVTTEAEDTVSATGATASGASASAELAAGRYVQAGSFRTVSHAEEERERLAAAGIDVRVISSDGAAELYPGFQVLLGGPFGEGAEERSLVRALKGNGVPSAFARDLTPAPRLAGADEAAGRWTGIVDRSSGERPSLDDSLPVTVEIDPDGSTGTLEVDGRCSESLTLSEEQGATLVYSQDTSCISAGSLFVRPTGSELMVSQLPLGTDIFVTGTLSRG